MQNIVPVLTLTFTIVALGACVGSFLNVCILRIPAGESIVTGPSHCAGCGERLRWWELVPIVSWLALRGKCARCKAKISKQYPAIEALNAALWALMFKTYGETLHTALCCLVASTLIVVAVVDARTMEIPRGLNIILLILGIMRAATDYSRWVEHAIGFAAVSVILLAIYLASGGRGVGGGDVKLMAGCGLFLGWRLIIAAFIAACVIGSILHLIRMAAKKAGRVLAFGPYLSAGVVIAMLWGERLIEWYLRVCGFAAN